MSYDLFVFKGPVPRTETDFHAQLGRFNDGDESAFETSPDLRRFREELLRRHPADLPEEEVDDSVWAVTPDDSDRLLTLNFAWPEAERMAREVPGLARRHRLALFDPQSGSIVRP